MDAYWAQTLAITSVCVYDNGTAYIFNIAEKRKKV